jgi:hypothetical protein
MPGMKTPQNLKLLAHHEASHAVVGIKIGIPIEYVEIDLERTPHGILGRGYCRYEDGFYPDASVVVRALAGPVGERQFDRRLASWPSDDVDILDYLHSEVRWGEHGEFTLTDLRRQNRLDVLYTRDDYSSAFNHIIRHHRFFVRHSIPRDRTMLRYFRKYEALAQRIVHEEWPAVERVAAGLLADPAVHLTGFEIEMLVRDLVRVDASVA